MVPDARLWCLMPGYGACCPVMVPDARLWCLTPHNCLYSLYLSLQALNMCFCFGVYNNTACLPAIISTCFGHIKYILSSRLFQQFVCYGINFSSSRISLNLALIHKPNSDELRTFRGETELRRHFLKMEKRSVLWLSVVADTT